jgi:nucleoside-diphosphate-sugar epimerase
MVHILLLGGHGKVALHMTRLFAARGHQVTSIIRNSVHAADIKATCTSPLVSPVVANLEEATPDSAKKLMDHVDWVVWSAGAGGKGGKERTKSVDEDAAKKFIAAALETESVKRFLMVSASCARHQPASWWNEEDLKVCAPSSLR